jgi:hypothetical protein
VGLRAVVVANPDVGELNYLVALALRRASAVVSLSEKVVAVPFDFSSPVSQVLGAANVGDTFNRVAALIEVAFDAAGARVRLGTSADLSLFFDSSLDALGQYENDALVPITVADVIVMTVDALGSVVGSGVLLYKTLSP